MSRTGKELLNATRPFMEQSRARSWWHVGSTLAILAATLAVAGLAPWWPLRLAASIVGGLVMARAFILFHDFTHGSILRGSRMAKVVLYPVGYLMLVPPRSWRVSHNHHHANVSELNGPAIGSFPIMTTAAWRVASPWRRLLYRLSRHPLTILSSYVTIFLASMTIEPLVRNPRRNWDSLAAIAVHGGALVGLWALGGAAAALLVLVLPYAICAVLGSYLFYVQHNFPGVRIPADEERQGSRALLDSSSFLEVGPIARWMMGNINYHHVHHLNSAIPFYRLPEAMAAIPELQRPVTTTLRPRDIRACLASNLWDEDAARMVSYRTAATAARATAATAARAASSALPVAPRITGDVSSIGVG